MNYNYLNETTARGIATMVVAEQHPTSSIPIHMIVNPLLRPVLAKPTVGQISSEQKITFWQIATAASIGLSAYHGYKRNDSLGWGIAWGLLGGLFPIITPAIAVAEGFGVRKR